MFYFICNHGLRPRRALICASQRCHMTYASIEIRSSLANNVVPGISSGLISLSISFQSSLSLRPFPPILFCPFCAISTLPVPSQNPQ